VVPIGLAIVLLLPNDSAVSNAIAHMITNRKFFLLLVCLVCSLAFINPALGAGPRPNIVLILADDLGYETLGAYGGTAYKTQVLDKLAAQGIRFDHCYVQPLCTPT